MTETPRTEDIRDRVAEQAREVLPLTAHGAQAQVAPLNETQLRVTYRDGSFRILDIGGFVAVGNFSDQAVHAWAHAMLVGEGPLPSHVPLQELRPAVVGAAVAEQVEARPVGAGLVEVLMRGNEMGGNEFVSGEDIAAWGVEAGRIFDAVRREFAATPFTPQPVAEGVIRVGSDEGAASAWALYPTVLKMALGSFEAPAWVWIPDAAHLIAANGHQEAAVARAQELADRLWADASHPVSAEPFISHARQLRPARA